MNIKVEEEEEDEYSERAVLERRELYDHWHTELSSISTLVYFSVGYLSSPVLMHIVNSIALDFGMNLKDQKVNSLLQLIIKEAVEDAELNREDLKKAASLTSL